jgi:hypothetical protein
MIFMDFKYEGCSVNLPWRFGESCFLYNVPEIVLYIPSEPSQIIVQSAAWLSSVDKNFMDAGQ